MGAKQFYNRAIKNGITLEHTCVGITVSKWEELMKGAVKANTELVNRIVKKSGQIDSYHTDFYNPYTHFRTKTHIVYAHSGIEYFFKVD